MVWRVNRLYLDFERGDFVKICELCVASPDNVAHLKAIRIRAGECVEFIDFYSRLYTAVFEERRGRDEYVFSVREVSEIAPEKPVIHLFQAKTKTAKLEFTAQRAVEAGACRIVFCDTEYSDRACSVKIDRLKKIAREAALQSKASALPEIEVAGRIETLDFSEYDRVLFFYEGASARVGNLRGVERIALIIGSEGGFSEREAEWARANFGEVYSLGNRIYRAETASIAALAIVWHESGKGLDK